MWWLFLPGALGVAAVLAIGAALNSGPKHPRHAAPRHLEAVPDLPGWGSMDLDAERAMAAPTVLLAAPVDPEPWRARTMAELSPEALGHQYGSEAELVAELERQGWFDPERSPANPGAGDVGCPPEPPAPAHPYCLEHDQPLEWCAHHRLATGDTDWLEAQMAATFNWAREARVRLAAI